MPSPAEQPSTDQNRLRARLSAQLADSSARPENSTAPATTALDDVEPPQPDRENVLQRALEVAGSEPSLIALLLASAAGAAALRSTRLDFNGGSVRIKGTVSPTERGQPQPTPHRQADKPHRYQRSIEPQRRSIRPTAPPVSRVLPQEMGEAVAQQRTRFAREEAIRFLQATELHRELEHLGAIEERLTAGSWPAQHHAALSTRLLLRGVADRCLLPSDQPVMDRFSRPHPIEEKNVGNRIAAFVDNRLRSGLSDEEHRLFVATLDTVARWSGRGPHRIYARGEAEVFLLRLFETLAMVSRAFSSQPFKSP